MLLKSIFKKGFQDNTNRKFVKFILLVRYSSKKGFAIRSGSFVADKSKHAKKLHACKPFVHFKPWQSCLSMAKIKNKVDTRFHKLSFRLFLLTFGPVVSDEIFEKVYHGL